MNTTLIAVLICFGLCLKIALTIAAIQYLRRSSSKITRKRKRQGGRREASVSEKKAESRPVLESSTGPDTKEQASSLVDKPLKPTPVAKVQQPETQATGTVAATTEMRRMEKPRQEPPAGKTPEGERKMMKVVTGPPRKKGEKIEVVEIRKQVEPKNIAPVGAQTPSRDLKDDSTSGTALTGTGTPREQAAANEAKDADKTPQEPMAGAIVPDETTMKEDESGAEDNQTSSEPAEGASDSEETEEDTQQKDKSGLGDLADLFATNASDFTEKSKLAEQVQEVDVNDILQEGLGLLGKVKKPDE
ncbi:MAG: hypothetical protein WC562_00445 [Dehalococcoidia bacterium]